jgi:hypothetical protein
MSLSKFLTGSAVALTLALGGGSSAFADVFTLANSNGGDGYVVGIPGGFDLFGSNNGALTNTATYLATASANETLTFNWVYSTADCCGGFYDPAGYDVNGVLTQLSLNLAPGVGSSGTATLSLNAGDSYGFYVYSPDSILGRGDIAVTSAVPEPSTWAMLLLGFAGIGFMAYRRKSKPALMTA